MPTKEKCFNQNTNKQKLCGDTGLCNRQTCLCIEGWNLLDVKGKTYDIKRQIKGSKQEANATPQS